MERPLPRVPQLTGAAPAHVQIERWLVRSIGRGELTPGDRLPNEQVLAAAIGVSRMTLRQALGRLQLRGVISRIPGRNGGTFVAEPRIDCDLSGWAGFTAVMRRADLRVGARVVSAVTVPASAEVAAALELPVTAPVHHVVRVRSATRVPLALERSWFPAATFPGLVERRLTGSLYGLLRRDYGQEPRTADEVIDPVVAGDEESRLLGVREGTPLLLVVRTAATAAGLPVEYARDTFRPDRVRLRVRSDVAAAAPELISRP